MEMEGDRKADLFLNTFSSFVRSVFGLMYTGTDSKGHDKEHNRF